MRDSPKVMPPVEYHRSDNRYKEHNFQLQSTTFVTLVQLNMRTNKEC